jgi:glycosyltransferase involved in cell wall biosynthesis
LALFFRCFELSNIKTVLIDSDLALYMANVAMVVTNACDPDPRVVNSARWLVEAGHNVTIHAYDRQHSSQQESEIDGVLISRYQLGKSPYGGLVKTALGLKKFTKKAISLISKSKPDMIICHDADTLEVGCSIKKSLGVPLVLDMHDLQHTWILMPNPKSLFRRIASLRMKQVFLKKLVNVDLIITSSGSIENGKYPGFKQWLSSFSFQSTVVENRPMEAVQILQSKRDDWTVSHIGRIRDIDSIELLLAAIKIIPKNQRPKLLIAGDGTSWNKAKQKIEQFSQEQKIEFEVRGPYRKKDLPNLLGETNVMYALYDPTRGNINDGALPVKMFDAASFGIPTIVNSNCLMAEICESEKLGISVEWGNSQALAEALLSQRNIRVKLEKTASQFREVYLSKFHSLLEL